MTAAKGLTSIALPRGEWVATFAVADRTLDDQSQIDTVVGASWQLRSVNSVILTTPDADAAGDMEQKAIFDDCSLDPVVGGLRLRTAVLDNAVALAIPIRCTVPRLPHDSLDLRKGQRAQGWPEGYTAAISFAIGAGQGLAPFPGMIFHAVEAQLMERKSRVQQFEEYAPFISVFFFLESARLVANKMQE